MSACAGRWWAGSLSMGLAAIWLSGCDRPPATVAVVPVVHASEMPAPSATTVAPSGADPTAISAPTTPIAGTATGKPATPVWACDLANRPTDKLVIYRRREDGGWKEIQPSAYVGHPARLTWAVQNVGSKKHLCAFIGTEHAWVAGYYDNRLGVYSTSDGGQIWVFSEVEPDATELNDVAMTFRDTLHGKLSTFSGGGHDSGFVLTIVTHVTSDGGRTWQEKSVRCRSVLHPGVTVPTSCSDQ